MLDRDYENPYIGLYRHHVTAETVSQLFCAHVLMVLWPKWLLRLGVM